MNFCFIGCGEIAHIVGKELKKSGRHNIVSVYSRNLKKASNFAKKFGGIPYTDILEAAKNDAVEGIYICTPHGVHYSQLKLLLDLKKPILCEKAFTINSRQAEEIFRIANEKKVLVVEAMWMYFNPNIKKIKEIVDSNSLGKITEINAAFCFNHKFFHPFKPKNRMINPLLGAGALLDVTIYPIAFSYLMLGKPITSFSILKIKNGYDYTDKIMFKSKNFAISKIEGSVVKFKNETATITFEKGKIVVPVFHKANSFQVITKNGIERHKEKSGYIYEFDQFEEDYKNGLMESSIMKQAYTIDILKIMDECRKQTDFYYPKEIERL